MARQVEEKVVVTCTLISLYFLNYHLFGNYKDLNSFGNYNFIGLSAYQNGRQLRTREVNIVDVGTMYLLSALSRNHVLLTNSYRDLARFLKLNIRSHKSTEIYVQL